MLSRIEREEPNVARWYMENALPILARERIETVEPIWK
jgi:hypothetical protein